MVEVWTDNMFLKDQGFTSARIEGVFRFLSILEAPYHKAIKDEFKN